MQLRLAILFGLIMSLCLPTPTQATTVDLTLLIDTFVTRQFPEASSHLWIVNSTQWDGDEMIVDVNTIVVEKRQEAPLENRFLLLIIGGKLTATQSIPLDGSPECRPEEA